MNLLPARVAAGAGGVARLELAGHSLALPEALAAAAAGERELTAGVRPEALRVVAAPREGALRARALHVEYLGHEVLAHLELEAGEGGEGPRLVARLADGGAIARGEAVGVEIDPEALHLFGADGRALVARA